MAEGRGGPPKKTFYLCLSLTPSASARRAPPALLRPPSQCSPPSGGGQQLSGSSGGGGGDAAFHGCSHPPQPGCAAARSLCLRGFTELGGRRAVARSPSSRRWACGAGVPRCRGFPMAAGWAACGRREAGRRCAPRAGREGRVPPPRCDAKRCDAMRCSAPASSAPRGGRRARGRLGGVRGAPPLPPSQAAVPKPERRRRRPPLPSLFPPPRHCLSPRVPPQVSASRGGVGSSLRSPPGPLSHRKREAPRETGRPPRSCAAGFPRGGPRLRATQLPPSRRSLAHQPCLPQLQLHTRHPEAAP